MAACTFSTVLGWRSPFLSFLEGSEDGLAQALAVGLEGVDPQGQRPLIVQRHLVDADGHAFGSDPERDLLDELGLEGSLDRGEGHSGGGVQEVVDQHARGIAVGDVALLGVVSQPVLDGPAGPVQRAGALQSNADGTSYSHGCCERYNVLIPSDISVVVD